MNNYLQWELQPLVPYCVRRNQGGSLFCHSLYSALHWQVMPLVPPVKQNCNGASLRTFQHVGMAVMKWEFCFLSQKPGMQQKGVNNVYPPLKVAPRRCEGEEDQGFEAQIQNSFTIPTGHQTFFTQTVTLICQKNWEKWSTMVERITKMPQAKNFKDLFIAVHANMGWDGEGLCTHSWSRNSNTNPNSKWCYACCCCSLKQTIKKEIRGFIYLKDGIPLQIQSCEKPKYRNPTVESTPRKKTLLLLLCIYMPVHQECISQMKKVWWTVVCPQKEACNKDVVGNGGCIDLLQKLWEVTNPRPITEEIAHVPDHSFKSSLEAQRQR